MLHLPKPYLRHRWINYRQREQVQMSSRYGIDDLWIMGRYSWSLDNVQISHGYPMDNPTRYLPCICSISTLYPAVIHTYTVQEHRLDVTCEINPSGINQVFNVARSERQKLHVEPGCLKCEASHPVGIHTIHMHACFANAVPLR